MKNLTTLLVLCSILLISACGPMYNVNYTFQQPKSWKGKQCVSTCLQNRTTCTMQCNAQNEQCRNNARQAALPSYAIYLANKEEHDKNPHKTIDDFANYSGCDSSCNCEDTYKQCFGTCGGVIIEHRQCVAFCDKANNPIVSRKVMQ